MLRSGIGMTVEFPRLGVTKMRILELLKQHPEGLRFTDIYRYLHDNYGIKSKATVAQHLQELIEEGFIIKDGDRYKIQTKRHSSPQLPLSPAPIRAEIEKNKEIEDITMAMLTFTIRPSSLNLGEGTERREGVKPIRKEEFDLEKALIVLETVIIPPFDRDELVSYFYDELRSAYGVEPRGIGIVRFVLNSEIILKYSKDQISFFVPYQKIDVGHIERKRIGLVYLKLLLLDLLTCVIMVENLLRNKFGGRSLGIVLAEFRDFERKIKYEFRFEEPQPIYEFVSNVIQFKGAKKVAFE